MAFYPQSRFTYKGKHRLHDRFSNLLIMNAALCIASHYLVKGEAKFKPGEHAAWVCKQPDIEIKLPISGPLEAAISNQTLYRIQFSCVPREPQRMHFTAWAAGLGREQPTVTSGLNNVNANMVAPVFVKFYEAYSDWIYKRCGPPRNAKNWPPVWRFARVIRNSVSHGGKIEIDSKDDPVSWCGLTYSSTDKGRRPVGGAKPDLGAGDIFVLILEMSDALDELGCPT